MDKSNSAFGIGHCMVIVAAGTLTKLVQKHLGWTETSRTSLYIKRIAGFLVILDGIYFMNLFLSDNTRRILDQLPEPEMTYRYY